MEEIDYQSWLGEEVELINLKELGEFGFSNGDKGIVLGALEVCSRILIYIHFYRGTDLSFLSHNVKRTMADLIVLSPTCPKCGEELKDKFSIGLGEMIKKCFGCGWC
jgi:hypothetical protein